eukprot:TRINITY_DN1962_c0_g1_i8.p1 TRINITY_DN1962_c0_g1~~TRINITY_DN1962_c0_g1_i8.p1  ORF type:complete len:211 (-),score=26.91 TRINITY_DN1962_c0_g1_i8:422-1054(-)
MADTLRLILKFVGGICAFCVCFLGIMLMIQTKFQFLSIIIFALHLVVLGLVLGLAEFDVPLILNNFYLITLLWGRGVYAFCLGTMIMLPSRSHWVFTFQWWVAFLLMGVGIIYIILHFVTGGGSASAGGGGYYGSQPNYYGGGGYGGGYGGGGYYYQSQKGQREEKDTNIKGAHSIQVRNYVYKLLDKRRHREDRQVQGSERQLMGDISN